MIYRRTGKSTRIRLQAILNMTQGVPTVIVYDTLELAKDSLEELRGILIGIGLANDCTYGTNYVEFTASFLRDYMVTTTIVNTQSTRIYCSYIKDYRKSLLKGGGII